MKEIKLNEEQINLILHGLELVRDRIWDDPEGYVDKSDDEDEYDDDVIQKYIDDNIYSIVKQLKK